MYSLDVTHFQLKINNYRAHKCFYKVLNSMVKRHVPICPFVSTQYTQHHPTGSETTPPYAPRSSRFGSEPPYVEDDVDVWRYAIVSCMPETMTTLNYHIVALGKLFTHTSASVTNQAV